MASPPRGRWAEDPGLAGGGNGGPATVCGRSTIENLVAYYRDIEQGELDEEKLIELWQKTNGLHAVEEWVTHVDRHPSGWGALLMIHGIPEVTGRLRTKVQNYAIYSALFLSCMLSTALSSASKQLESCDLASESFAKLSCAVMKRIFFYSIVGSVTSHMLAILLAMSFVNALNETVDVLVTQGGGGSGV